MKILFIFFHCVKIYLLISHFSTNCIYSVSVLNYFFLIMELIIFHSNKKKLVVFAKMLVVFLIEITILIFRFIVMKIQRLCF
jgi:hypothetical protein